MLAETALVGDRDRARRVRERVLVEHARARHRELRWLRSHLHAEEELRAVNRQVICAISLLLLLLPSVLLLAHAATP